MNDPDAVSMRARCEEYTGALWRLTENQGRAGTDDENAALDRLLIGDALAQLSVEHRADDRHIADSTVKSRLHCALLALRLTLQEMEVTR